MTVHEVTPAVDLNTLLTGAQFADAFRIAIGDRSLDARQAAERMLTQQPRWIEVLTSLRNILVTPFGLKTSGASVATSLGMIGLFPVISETPDRLVAGFNDKHLDFRVVVDIADSDAVRNVTATTLVKTHNWLGRTYLAIIAPFHRLIVPTLLRQIAA
jgi:Protein of unknown function (DUF2867)